jgi:hypothetical protein
MFKISLPVQRFVVGSILLMIVIIVTNAILNEAWIWQDNILNLLYNLQ